MEIPRNLLKPRLLAPSSESKSERCYEATPKDLNPMSLCLRKNFPSPCVYSSRYTDNTTNFSVLGGGGRRMEISGASLGQNREMLFLSDEYRSFEESGSVIYSTISRRLKAAPPEPQGLGRVIYFI